MRLACMWVFILRLGEMNELVEKLEFFDSPCFFFHRQSVSPRSFFSALSSRCISVLHSNHVDARRKRSRCQEVAWSGARSKRSRNGGKIEKKTETRSAAYRLLSRTKVERQTTGEKKEEEDGKKGVRGDWTFAPCKHNRRPSFRRLN